MKKPNYLKGLRVVLAILIFVPILLFFVDFADVLPDNLHTLLHLQIMLTKERLNEFIKTGEVKEQSEIFEEFDVTMSVIESLLVRERDSEGKIHISWGSQRIMN